MAVPDPLPEPMLAELVAEVPGSDAVEGGLLFDRSGTGSAPSSRWNLRRCRDRQSRVEAADSVLPRARRGVRRAAAAGHPRRRRDHRARADRGRRAPRLAHPLAAHPSGAEPRRQALGRTPASFVGFDLLAEGGTSLLDEPFSVRRRALERVLAKVEPPVHLSQTTQDAEVARRWLVEFEGAGLDGVIAKPLAAPYSPGKRVMLKSSTIAPPTWCSPATGCTNRRAASARCCSASTTPTGGSSRSAGRRRSAMRGGSSSSTSSAAAGPEKDDSGAVVTGEGERSRFSSSKDVSFVRLRPERVLEVKYDQLEGWRFRHTVQFLRWRDDRDPKSCTYDQLEQPVAYDLSEVLA